MPEPLPSLRILLGILFMMLAPGYALQAALFPHRREQDGLTRAAFSFGLSIVVIPLIFLLLSTLGIGIQFQPIATALGILFLACAGVAFFRRRRSPDPVESEGAVKPDLKKWWASQDGFTRWVYGFLAAAFCTAAVSGTLVALEKPADPFTEFYLLDSQGLTMDYPREVTAGTEVVFLLGIRNREGQPGEYKILAVGGGNQALSSSDPIILADGETWQGHLTIVLDQAGDGQKVEFLLERVGSSWPYRTLRIWMNVDPAGMEKTAAPEPTAAP
jgi:uncharacterized membrane protein